MQDNNFATLSSEEKVTNIKDRILDFKARNPHLYPELRKEVMSSDPNVDPVSASIEARLSRFNFTKPSKYRR